ncbi:LytR family transcriptional regulator, partial [Enterococcus faecium]|nr:LytR family transcriptional regulator [Enterococcus faecium]
MKVFQKIILSVLLLLTLVVGFFSIEFVHGFSSAKQTSTV